MKIRAVLAFTKSLVFPKSTLKSSARKSVLGAVFCIGLSVIPLIIVVSVTKGMVQGMTDRMIQLSSGHLEFYVSRQNENIKNAGSFLDYKKKFEGISGVTQVFAEVDTGALAKGKDRRSGVIVRGVEPEIFEKNSGFKKYFKFKEGSAAPFMEQKGKAVKYAVVGEKTAEDLNLETGDNIYIFTVKRQPGGNPVPYLSVFKVSGIVSSGYQELDGLWVFVPVETSFMYATENNSSFLMKINTKDPFSYELNRTEDFIDLNFEGEGTCYSWYEINASELENFSSTRMLLIFIMIMIVLVASVNISSALIMLTMERRREIGILKSLGETPGGISLSFMLTGLVISVSGLLIAVPAGLLCSVFANKIVFFIEKVINLFSGKSVVLMDPAYYLTEIPVSIPLSEILLIVLGVLVLSLIFSIVPAVKAGKQKPLEILRNI